MHMIGTNLSLWLNVLIQETKHEILTFYDPENGTLMLHHRLTNHGAFQNHKEIFYSKRVSRFYEPFVQGPARAQRTPLDL